MKKIAVILAIIATVAVSCRTRETTKTETEFPTTELQGEFDPMCMADTIRIYIGDGVEEEEYSYPILDNMFAVSLPTDRMKLGQFIITYDNGIVSRFFIPEGGKIKITMNSKGHVDISAERENSLTLQYLKMSDELSRMKYGMVRQNDSLAKARNYNEMQIDSLRQISQKKLEDRLREQALTTVKSNKDNILGVLGLMNLLDVSGADAVRPLLKEMDPVVQNSPSIPDSLKN